MNLVKKPFTSPVKGFFAAYRSLSIDFTSFSSRLMKR